MNLLFCYFQTLTDGFRLNYCHLWMSLIKADLEGIKHYAHVMNCGELYGLFACILTGRSWKMILTGIDKKPVSKDEVNSIYNFYFNFILQILIRYFIYDIKPYLAILLILLYTHTSMYIEIHYLGSKTPTQIFVHSYSHLLVINSINIY